MLEIFKDKQTNLEFGLNIQGNSFAPEVRLCISLYENLFFVIKGRVENNIAYVSIPPLKDSLQDTQFDTLAMFLEVIADQNYFIPWRGEALVSNSISVGVTDVQYEKVDTKKNLKVESTILTAKEKIKFL